MKMKKSTIVLVVVALLFLMNKASTYFVRWIMIERAKTEILSRQQTSESVNEGGNVCSMLHEAPLSFI